ncbi:hypothetical protein BDN70DRAFT_893887 [Pholiota conissans]|uniref:Heat shock 70 kDa protein 12A n=1 Tax=Pholiota conissans TaxID=109636 RepID=A0A9P5Z643_9AGAR|nr:hypothetical protein BDN70DRAFT_893887 [Pholiota conissans]
MSARAAYSGTQRKLVLALDVGTTFSGISYCILDPGQVPEIKGVTRFPAHEQVNGASKIPTIIYYDRSGKVQAVGAEAMVEGIYEQAEEEHWIKAEWFKLHLRSTIAPGAGKEVSDDIPPLPLNKSVVEVLADFLAYLFKCAESYIQDAHLNGVNLWTSVKEQIDFVLSHPNGWEGTQQSEMRKATVLAGLIPDTTRGRRRLSFVTEGEASLHFAIQHGLQGEAVENGNGVVIVDAGGGTIDISSYSKNTSSKQTFEEIAVPQFFDIRSGHFYGSIFVSVYAHRFLSNYLADSPFVDDVKHIVRCFDKTTKLKFRNVDSPQYVKFGSTRDNDASHSIRFGQLKLLGMTAIESWTMDRADIAPFFEPSVNCIIKAVLEQRKNAHKPISHVVLVGGFASSDYLLDRIHSALGTENLSIHRPDTHVNKAVSDGAISFYLDHVVRTRISKITYGTFYSMLYNPNEPDHKLRRKKAYTSESGDKVVPDSFDIILPKNTQISEAKEFRQRYVYECASSAVSDSSHLNDDIWCYRGHITEPKWKDVDTKNYRKLCKIDTKLSNLPMKKTQKTKGSGVYYIVKYDIILIFGLTELKAQIAWKEKGVEKRSEAKIIYEPDTPDGGN